MIITHSSLECFKSCRQKYKLRYIDGIVSKNKPEALAFGTAMHHVLEYYFKRIQVVHQFNLDTDGKTSFDKVCDIDESCGDVIERIDYLNQVDKVKLVGLISGYIREWYESDCRNYEVIDVEKEFKLPIGNTDWKLRDNHFVGKIDALVKDKDTGEYFIIEHKTASVVDESYISQKSIDSQTMTYAIFLERELGIKISGVIHDIIIKQKIRQKKGESEDEFCERLLEDVTEENFNRILISIDRKYLEEFRDELYESCLDLITCNRHYKCTGNCLGRFGACEYLDLCKSGGLIEEIADRYEHREPFEEISSKTLNMNKGE